MPRLGSDPLTPPRLWYPSCWWLVILGGWFPTTSPPHVSFWMWPSLYDQLWKICSASLRVIFRKSCSTSSCLSVWVEQRELSVLLLHHLAKLCPHSSLFVRLWLQGTENQPEIAYAKRKLRCLMVSKGSNSWIQKQGCCQWLSILSLLVPFLPLFRLSASISFVLMTTNIAWRSWTLHVTDRFNHLEK